MRKLVVLVAVLMMVLTAPMALAQDEPPAAQSSDNAAQKDEKADEKAWGPEEPSQVSSDEPADESETSPPASADRSATFAFELAVEGDAPAGSRFFGAVSAEGCISVPLTDPDGDGTYTGSLDVPRFPPGPVPPPDAQPVSLPVQIVQADGGESPCDPTRTIKDFGQVPANDRTFSASVSFDDDQEPVPGDEVEATGTLRELDILCNECARHDIADEESGVRYQLISDRVDLSDYAGERVTVQGTLQAVGENLLNVTSVKPVGGGGEETVEVTFELTIEGEPPEGTDFYLDSILGGEAPDLIFCSTRPEIAGEAAPLCESGEIYSEARNLYADDPFSYEFFTSGPGGGREVFSAGTETFTEDDTVSATYNADDPTQCSRDFILGCGPEDVVTATFELTVEGEPPADATFFATGVFDPRLADAAGVQQLTDPDGDGVYTATQDTLPGDYDLRIVQGTGTRSCSPEFGGTCPGEPRQDIKDFGNVAIEDDETFSASVSFDESGNNGSNNGGSGSNGGSVSDGGFLGVVAGNAVGLLPSTGGGITLTVLGVGAALVAGGFLLRRLGR